MHKGAVSGTRFDNTSVSSLETEGVRKAAISSVVSPLLDFFLSGPELGDTDNGSLFSLPPFNQFNSSTMLNPLPTTNTNIYDENPFQTTGADLYQSSLWDLELLSMNLFNTSTQIAFSPSNDSQMEMYNSTINFSNETQGMDFVPSSRRYYSLYETILIGVVTGMLAIVTLIGNLMVMISFKIDKQLQTISNYFLFSLAIADITIGVISMPLFTMYTLLGYWPLGALICDTWLALDYLASNASVLNLLIISFDRYFSVMRPLTYRAKRTTKRAASMIGSAWLISLILWPPWIYSWPYIEGKRTVPVQECYIQFIETNEYVTFGTAIAAFYLPVTVMIGLYWRIWRETEKRQKDLTNLQAGNKDHSKRSNSRPEITIQPDPTSCTDTAFSRSEAEDCLEQELRRQRSESSTAMEEIETTYVPSSMVLGNAAKAPLKKSKFKCCRGISSCLKKTIDGDEIVDIIHKGQGCHFSGYHTPSYNATGYQTPGSAETTIAGSVSRCPSINYIKEPTPLSSNRLKTEAMTPLVESTTFAEKQQHRPHPKLHASSTLPRMDSGVSGSRSVLGARLHARSYSSDSVYTILIRLPQEAATEGILPPSILMIEEEDPANKWGNFKARRAIEANNRNPLKNIGTKTIENVTSECVALGPSIADYHGQTEPSDISNIMCPRSNHATEVKVPLNARIVPKQLIRNSNSGGSGGSTANSTSTGTTARKKKKKSTEKKQDRKAAKTLSAILLTFIITWTPYNVLVLLKTLLSCEDCIPARLWHFVYYLCYINSTINPMCYALCNAAFRRTYVRILTCKWHNRKKQGIQRGYYS